MNPLRWTFFLYLFPTHFIEGEYDWSSFSLKEWTREDYTYEADPRFKDFVTPPSRVIEEGNGDCEDYATVAMNALYFGGESVSLAFLFTKSIPPTGHVVAFTETHIYSSGTITEESIEAYVERSKYDFIFTRNI